MLAAYQIWAEQWADHGPTRAFAICYVGTGDLVGGCELRILARRGGRSLVLDPRSPARVGVCPAGVIPALQLRRVHWHNFA